MGPNAAGKSNLFDALQLLSRLVTCKTLKEAFSPPYRGLPLESFSFGKEGIEGLLKEASAAFTIEADVELSPSTIDRVNRHIREMKRPNKHGEHPTTDARNEAALAFVRERNLRYRIEVEILPQSGILRVADEFLCPLNREGRETKRRRPFLERMGDRIHLRMEGQAHPTYFERYLDHSILSLPLYPPHYPHLTAFRQELANWLFFYFEPRERMRVANPIKEVRHIGMMGEELAAFLNTLKATEPAQFEAIEKALRIIIPSARGLDIKPNSLGEVELRLLEGDTPIPARVLSEGTLRIIGLLALMSSQDPPALIGFEEPENGIHPRRIQLVAELLKSRLAEGNTQVLATTHSAILCDYIPPDCLLVCRNDQGRSVITPFTGEGLFRKPAIDDALAEPPMFEETPTSVRILRGDLDA
ncbi:MAG: hypothetical protein OZSIB_0169 [Candidatus Ozemobacter sibiricus]|uniref:ATPase AAA-type core domain-containing protein n=1 Tax=Candidatus Ozemobacter sibiricus TaxID=2268124 RepID=A0A367ZME4_9BACT|nr:MAG: hypothetical protein OZSIB_0169 [Candidatus Ozemobacter sibiricus]